MPLRLYAFIDLLVLKRFRKVVAVSLEIAKALEVAGLAPERILVIPNGVNVSNDYVAQYMHLPNGPEHNRIIIGAVGRLVEAKGFQHLLQAGPALLHKFPFIKFYIVGNGPFRPQLERLSENLGIQSHVTFAGEQEDMASVYSSINIFVLPSLNEGMPMTVLEAMAAGKPVVASSVGGIPQVVTSEDTGLLVEPGSVDSLRGALTRLIEDPAFRTALGNRAKTHVSQTYSVEHMARKYADLYETLH
jgi:glycosyltransferase involved in cell wall biosynthesis